MPQNAPPSDDSRQRRRQQVARLARRPLRLARESARALVELARARGALARLTMAEVERRNRRALAVGSHTPDGGVDLIERVKVIVPLVAWRVPWRSDCLVQALAAQRWLQAEGIASRIVIGADKPGKEGLEAHAWLLAGDQMVTGGEVERFTVLFDSADRPGLD